MSNFFITGTDTDVGKTLVTALILHSLQQRGYHAAPYKPVQSGGIIQNGKLIAPDIDFYEKVTGKNYENAYTYLMEPAYSPHYAARLEKMEIKRENIISHYHSLVEKSEIVLVEGAGGMAVPIIDESYCVVDLMVELNLPIIIVARSSLGTINHTTLTVEYAKSKGLKIAGIIMNGFATPITDAEKNNIDSIEKLTGVQVIGTIPIVENLEENLNDKDSISRLASNIDIEKLLESYKGEFV